MIKNLPPKGSVESFTQFSDFLRCCLQICRDITESVTHFESFRFRGPSGTETLGQHLRTINAGRDKVKSHIDRMNGLNVLADRPTNEVGDRMFLSVHEAALSILNQVHAGLTAGIPGVSLWPDFDSADRNVRLAILNEHIMQLLDEAKRLPAYRWNELDVELRRECVWYQQAYPMPDDVGDDVGQDETQEGDKATIPSKRPPYKWKESLIEDEWIHENIHAYSFDDLRVEHHEHCQSQEHFKKPLSRRSYWARADRYADYHGLDKRRFKGACECPDCQPVTDT